MNLSNEITIELYRINVLTNQFVKIDEVITHKNLRWFDRLNGLGGATFNLEIQDPKADITNWIPFVTQVAIRVNNKIVWVGVVERPSGGYNGVSGNHSVRCISYLYHLTTRYVTLTYKNQDAAAKAWDMIDEVQSRNNGEMMIREGTIETVGNTSDTLQNQSVAQAIMNQSDNLVGYDFQLLPVQNSSGQLEQVNFNAFNQIGITRDRYAPLEFGFTVDSADYSLDGEVFNNITGEGAGTSTGILSASKSDGDSQVKYTRRENVAPFKNILSYKTLNTVTQARLDDVKNEKYAVSISLRKGSVYQYGAFNVGDFLQTNLEFPNGLVINQLARVIELGYSVDNLGVITLEPKLEIIL